MRTGIKICGIKNADEIKIINKYPLDYIGFIFAESKRKITLEQAINLRSLVRKDIQVVGVFVNEKPDIINSYIKDCNLQVIQLHGEETVDECEKINAKVWKSFSIKDKSSLDKIHDFIPSVDGILLDTFSNKEKGGTGKTFNWELIKCLPEDYPIILAGGLTPDNIVEAIEFVKPQIADINSGVETNLIKDEEKIQRVFKRLKEAGINE